MVTGGAGFIGSELVRQLAALGAEVLVVDNLTNGSAENLRDVECRLEVRDIRSEGLKALVQDVDIIYHLACLGVRHSIHSPLENHQVNAEATLQLLIAAKDGAVGRFVYVSSSEVYGTAQYGPMTENHPTFPLTVYGASKLAGECYSRAFWETYGYPTVMVRPFNSYGPRSHHEGDSGEVIPKFLLRLQVGKELIIFGDGKQTRDFTHVSDTARGILLAGQCDQAVGQTMNIGSGHEVSINELADLAKDVTGKPEAKVSHVDSRPGDVLRLYADSSKAYEMLGFRARMSFKQGLTELLAWYASQERTPEQMLADEVEKNWELSKH